MFRCVRRLGLALSTVSLILVSIALTGSTGYTGAASAANEHHIRFLHLADLHAQLEEHWEFFPEHPDHLRRMGGFARIKTVLEQKRRESRGPVFTMDGGDTFQGSALAAWTQGEAVISPLNALMIDVGVPGNWDVVYGPQVFRKLFRDVNYRVVCYNFHETEGGTRLFPPAIVLEREGVRVAFVGVTDPTTTVRQPPAEVTGLDSTRLDGLRRFVQKLREKERPDLMVLLDHTGLAPSVQLAHDIPEFDIVFSGHTHERVYEPILVGQTIVVEPGSMGSFLGQLDVTLKDGRITSSHFQLIEIDAAQFPEDAQVKQLIETVKAPFASRLSEVVGETKTTLRRYDVLEASMDNLIADAVREATQ
ncbi:MAG: bifunctional metallophosphatase/5'-nucleotidase, partial [Nitrospira sp.]